MREILADVRLRGDQAVLEYTRKYDGAVLQTPALLKEEFAAARKAADPAVLSILARAAENIRAFHNRQRRESWLEEKEDGVILGQRFTPLERVGAYVPGGGAAYPSSVLMTIIPARVAGVKEVVLVTPPNKDGKLNPYTLAAAEIAGADAVFKCGGAQAVGALAYGTETIPKIDKIVGPGNIYVTLAKREVSGIVGTDMPAGPSEVLVLADDTACTAYVAADLLSQAEHDPMAAAYCVTTSPRLAGELAAELERQCAALERSSIIQRSLTAQGAIVLVETLEEGLDIVNFLAPEHLELHLADPWQALDGVVNAGAIFIGPYTPEPVGDYWAGPNHVLPTAGAARFSSVLSVDDFQKTSSVIFYPPQALLRAAGNIETLAAVEGFSAHAAAVKKRRVYLEQEDSGKRP